MISAFEYVTVLISIVLGLGITQILTGIADLIHQSGRVKIYWPHAVWVLLVLVMHVQDWWVTYELKNHQPWRLPLFLFVMLYPVNLFVLARLLFPFGLQDGTIDLKEFYLNNYRKIFGFACGLITLAICDQFVLREVEMDGLVFKSILLLGMILVTLKKKLPEWAHALVAVLFLVMTALTIVVEMNIWLIG